MCPRFFLFNFFSFGFIFLNLGLPPPGGGTVNHQSFSPNIVVIVAFFRITELFLSFGTGMIKMALFIFVFWWLFFFIFHPSPPGGKIIKQQLLGAIVVAVAFFQTTDLIFLLNFGTDNKLDSCASVIFNLILTTTMNWRFLILICLGFQF